MNIKLNIELIYTKKQYYILKKDSHILEII